MFYFELYLDRINQWRWRIKSSDNYKTLADSGESYYNKADAIYAINLIKNNAFSAIIIGT